MTESTGKMRDWIIALTEHDFSWKRMRGLDILDEIEREIAERYVELPLDADGVPIRVGDVVDSGLDSGKVQWLELWADGWVVVFDVGRGNTSRYVSTALRHVNPRTIADVLADFAADVERGRNDRETAMRYADEIRELLEVEQ